MARKNLPNSLWLDIFMIGVIVAIIIAVIVTIINVRSL